MRKLYSTKQVNIAVSRETYRQMIDTTNRVKESVPHSKHEQRKNNLSHLMGMTMYTEKEIKMFDLDRQYILMSALQKSIRWCEVNASRYFAQRLMDMGYPGGVFNRLLIIAAEDVGLADPSLLLYEKECYDEFDNKLKQNGIKKRDAGKFQDLCNIVDRAVIAAAICYKSRLLPFASFATLFDIYQRETFKENTSMYLQRFADAVDIGDEKQALYYAFVSGIFCNSMDRILAFLQTEGEIRNNHLIRQWVCEYRRKPELLVLVGVIVMLFRNFTFSHGEYVDLIDQYLHIPIKKAQIPDRAYDKHTGAGKRKGRGLEHFFKVAGTIKKERFRNDWEQTGRDAYLRAEQMDFQNTKKVIEAIKTKYERSQQQTAIHNPLTF